MTAWATFFQFMGGLTPIAVGVFAVWQKRAMDSARIDRNEVKKATEEVRVKLEETNQETAKALNEIAVTGNNVHTLVNSNMGVQLKISAVALRRVAELTKNKNDEAAASLAEKSLAEHERKQSMVDARKKN